MTKKKVPTVARAFMVLEATSVIGGFPAYMNMIMDDMRQEMGELGYTGPYRWTFSGGDGYAVPVILGCEFA